MIVQKIQLVEVQLFGIMIWELGQDYFFDLFLLCVIDEMFNVVDVEELIVMIKMLEVFFNFFWESFIVANIFDQIVQYCISNVNGQVFRFVVFNGQFYMEVGIWDLLGGFYLLMV